MKTRDFLAIALLLVVLTSGCDAQPPRPAAGTAPPAVQAQAKEAPPPAPPKDAVASLTRNFYFIFDGSGSMEEKCSGSKKINVAKKAIESFLKVVPTNANLGLVVFDIAGSREVVPLGPNNRAQFLQAVRTVSEGGGTPLNEAIKFGIGRLAEQRARQLNYGEFRLITVTDGEASDGDVGSENNCGPFSYRQAIPIYTIGLCLGSSHSLRKYSVTYKDANDELSLRKALEETVGESGSFGN